jgi:amino acid adenylation domain-containing protein
MIAAWAETTPDAIAVVDDDRTLTYRQLVDAAVGVASEIRLAGVSRDEVVGLQCPRGLDGLTGLLGIMLSGAACLYLDPAWPAQRRTHMTRECRLPLLLSADESADDDQDGPFPQRLRLDKLVEMRPTGDDAPWVHGVSPGDLCYVVYTSGSTGTPKGVAIEHGGAGNMARRLAVAFGVFPGVRMLQFSNWAWDAAACEILVTLGAGGTLVLAPDEARQGGEQLAELLRTQRIQVATLTPSVLAALPDADLPSLQTVISVGETCPPELVARWAPGRRFLNGYGPSEATVAVSVGRCWPGAPVTIGRPLRGVQVRVVDGNDDPVPNGAVGELIVGGYGIARGYITTQPDGYLGRSPAVTSASQFVRTAGTRWYRTGDLVRQRADGHLIYQGRADDQVKVNGHRIELSEVEHGLLRHPGIRACAVVASGGRLIAYVVPANMGVITSDLLAHAAEWLPGFMLPSEIQMVDTLPLNGNGKLNRPALTALAQQRPQDRDLLADTLALIRQALETPQVGPDDDVFEAGGHSLVAAQLAVAATQQFGVPIAALQVYDHPTAARLAALIRTLAPPDKAA